MAPNVRNYPGDRQRLAVASGTASGDLLTFGGRPAVALTDRDADGFATLQFKGIVDISVAATVAVGDLLYLAAAGGVVLSTDDEGIPFGIATEAVASGTATIGVKLLEQSSMADADGVAITIGAEAANVITVSLQFTKGGADAASPVVYDAWLSAAADGQLVKAAATSLAAGTDGTILVETVSNAVFKGVSEADGDADIAIGDAVGADTYFLNVVLPDGRRVVSDVITFAA